MTRETKIGLLVGLAFIIVIGILLSDHLTSSTEPPPAAISQAGPTARSAITTPIRHTQPPAGETVAPQVTPNQQVPTANDLVPRPQPVKIVQVDTPTNEPVTIQSSQAVQQQNEPPQNVVAITPPTNPPANETQQQRDNFERSIQQQLAQQQNQQPQSEPVPAPVTMQQTPRGNDPVLNKLNQEAAKFGEAVVSMDGDKKNAGFIATKYKAEPGDTLSKIATKMYGTSTKPLREAIVEANPSLKENPNLVIEGRTYVIPAVAQKAPANQSLAMSNKPAEQTSPVTLVPANTAKQPAAKESGATYVVQEGDNLTRIAIDQCGDENALAAIRELNREALNGGDIIRPGMKLRLPAKSVAVNN